MKKIIFISIFVAAVVLPVFVSANGNHSLSLEDVLAEITEAQNVAGVASIRCQEITDEQFEELGEAAMGVIHPNEQQHELMDQMMGGEGSESLRTMHLAMGENYLGCGTGAMGGGMMGGMDMMSMMSDWSGYSNNNSFNNMMYNMMGNVGVWGWFGWIFMILFWVLIIVGTIALIKWLIGQNTERGGKEKSALSILKERYAKGEINKEEFEEKKKDLS